MKILLCNYTYTEYGLDTLYDGLCRVLGNENVFNYPSKSAIEAAKYRKNYSRYPLYFNHPNIADNELKMQMLENNEFDIIIVGCHVKNDYRKNRKEIIFDPNRDIFFNLLREKSKITQTYIVDTDDRKGINYQAIDILNCQLYFKREYLLEYKQNPRISPFNLSYSEKYFPENINTTRENTVFWMGVVGDQRKPYIDLFKKIINYDIALPNFLEQDTYRQNLLKYKIGLSLKGYGDDTVRYYEIPAHGMLLLSQRLDIIIENDFKDGETAVFFETPEEMVEKIKYCIDNPDYTDKIAKAGYEWIKKYHTTTARANQFLAKIFEDKKL